MDNEAFRLLAHHEAADVICAELNHTGYTAKREVVLPDGRRADVLAIDDEGNLSIVEVKTRLSESLILAALEKYTRWCNSLWLAQPDMPNRLLSQIATPLRWPDAIVRTGIIAVYRDSIVCARQAGYRRGNLEQLVAARAAFLKA